MRLIRPDDTVPLFLLELVGGIAASLAYLVGAWLRNTYGAA